MSIDGGDFRPSSRFGTLTGRHVLVGFVAAFGVIFAVNGMLIFKALSTFDGIEVPDAYQRGRAYNHVLEAMEAQKALGWSGAVSIDDNGRAHEARLIVQFSGRDGTALRDLKIRGSFWRPVAGGADQEQTLRETAPGRYEADFRLAYGGNWLVRIAAEGPRGEKFASEKRVYVRD